MSRLSLSSRADGFSFIELLATLAIIATLAAMAMPLAQTTLKRHKEHELRRALRDIRQAIDAYKVATTDGRIVQADGAGSQNGYPPTLAALAAGVPNAKAQGGAMLYFLRRVPRDPFHPNATTPAAQTWGTRRFDSPPDQPLAGDDVFDVYSLSTQTGLNGVAYREW
ncbi:type II secretion system protein [Chitinimonas arctica]|uniref:Type II secretion system protein n=1 Tax=Chitinimonas arctica TaxID=2594795 RepID=A0A516SCY2_9NEIS|nr:type II secretion system protein [Chitinimonas arctica]QDQ26005.1 type II secretion system protein [Chitinimonas arctica]